MERKGGGGRRGRGILTTVSLEPAFFFFLKSSCARLRRTCVRVHEPAQSRLLVSLSAGCANCWNSKAADGRKTFLFRFPDESGDVFQCCH